MNAATSRPTTAQVLLGLFILWQIVFLLITNSLGVLMEDLPPPVFDVVDGSPEPAANRPTKDVILDVLSVPARRWADLTGQWQGWGLFAPTALPQTTLIRLRLHWDGAGGRDVVLHSLFEPQDPKHYWRLPGTNLRIHNHEWRLAGSLMVYQLPGYDPSPVVWSEFLRDQMRSKNGVMRAYLRYRLQQYLHEHPEERPPDEMIFAVRLMRMPLTGPTQEPIVIEQPLARWRPQAPERPNTLPVEVFDPLTKRFETLAPFPG